MQQSCDCSNYVSASTESEEPDFVFRAAQAAAVTVDLLDLLQTCLAKDTLLDTLRQAKTIFRCNAGKVLFLLLESVANGEDLTIQQPLGRRYC